MSDEESSGTQALARPGIEPLGANERSKSGWQHFAENLGLALSPPQLAMLITFLPLVATGREAVLAVTAGIAAGSSSPPIGSRTFSARAALTRPVAMLAQVIFGNIQRLVLR